MFAQNEEKPELQITGSARMVVKPDIGVLNIGVTSLENKMADAISKLGDISKYYVEALQKIGFTDKDIKTTKFSVNTNRVYVNDNYVDSGYVASQQIRLEFKYNQKLLEKILATFSLSEQSADFSFDFKLSEELKQQVQSEIISQAVIDAKQKASDIAKSSSLILKRITRIGYGGWGGNSGMEKLEREQRYMASAAMASSGGFNFNPDDLIFRDTVNITWEIEEK